MTAFAYVSCTAKIIAAPLVTVPLVMTSSMHNALPMPDMSRFTCAHVQHSALIFKLSATNPLQPPPAVHSQVHAHLFTACVLPATAPGEAVRGRLVRTTYVMAIINLVKQSYL